jgi:hypothetical protein
MRITLFFVGFIVISLLNSSCRNPNQYQKQVKELDSLKVVLQEAIVNFNTIDSAKCVEVYAQQFTYASFIKSNLKDTVSMATAEQLQLFYSVGKNLVNFLVMSPDWKDEAKQTIKQLTDLSHDLKNGSLEEETVFDFVSEENRHANKIIEELKTNTELMRYSLDVFSKSLPVVQETVKKLNNGAVPELVHPDIRKKPKKH